MEQTPSDGPEEHVSNAFDSPAILPLSTLMRLNQLCCTQCLLSEVDRKRCVHQNRLCRGSSRKLFFLILYWFPMSLIFRVLVLKVTEIKGEMSSPHCTHGSILSIKVQRFSLRYSLDTGPIWLC